ncbi:Rv2231c family pyridoxal phosphate-dependent protein CobC [Nocardioides maradonensis]
MDDPLLHHGDVETGAGLLDFAVNVFSGPRPAWLDRALHDAVDASGTYPSNVEARQAIATAHRRDVTEVLPTSGAAEAFTLVARMRPWRRPVVVHPQFTEPHAALVAAGHEVTEALCAAPAFALSSAAIPDDADLVVVGNPTNPTGVLHPADHLRALLRPGRVVVVDEAFLDAVPGEPETLTGLRETGLLVIRSLTKHWSIPGIRAGYVIGDAALVAELERHQPPWSVAAPALAATVACLSDTARAEAHDRATTIAGWRAHLEAGLDARGIRRVPSEASFVLAQVGAEVREQLRERGIAVRRADTFPGLDASWVRIAVRPPDLADKLLVALDE